MVVTARDEQAPVTVLAGRYRLDAPLASGGMGQVYRATQLSVDRVVAVKLMSPERTGQVARGRFEQEARLLAAIDHPHIVSLIDYGIAEDGRQFLVMEHLAGESLAAVIAREGALPEARCRDIALQLLDAIAAAHARGLVHRDLKPSNVFLVWTDDGRDFVKLLDFGIAKPLEMPSDKVDLTASRDVVGSPRYLSPEQAQRQPVTQATDVYAFGCILYEMLSGQPVFADEVSALGHLLAHARRTPDPPSVEGRPLAGPLVEWTMRCLAKAPWERPESAAAVRAALQSDASVTAPEPVVVRRRPGGAPRRRIRWPWLVGAGLSLCTAVVAAAVVSSNEGSAPVAPSPDLRGDWRGAFHMSPRDSLYLRIEQDEARVLIRVGSNAKTMDATCAGEIEGARVRCSYGFSGESGIEHVVAADLVYDPLHDNLSGVWTNSYWPDLDPAITFVRVRRESEPVGDDARWRRPARHALEPVSRLTNH